MLSALPLYDQSILLINDWAIIILCAVERRKKAPVFNAAIVKFYILNTAPILTTFLCVRTSMRPTYPLSTTSLLLNWRVGANYFRFINEVDRWFNEFRWYFNYARMLCAFCICRLEILISGCLIIVRMVWKKNEKGGKKMKLFRWNSIVKNKHRTRNTNYLVKFSSHPNVIFISHQLNNRQLFKRAKASSSSFDSFTCFR